MKCISNQINITNDPFTGALMESLKIANKSFESKSPTHRARSVTISIDGTLTSIMLPSQHDQKPPIPNKSTKPRSLTIQEKGNMEHKIGTGNVPIGINNPLISSGLGKDEKTNSGFLFSVPSHQPRPDEIDGNKGNKTGSHHDRTGSFESDETKKSSHDDELKRNQKIAVLHSRENSIGEDHGVMLVQNLHMARKESVVGGFRKIPTPSKSFGAYLLVKSDKDDEFDEEYDGPIQKLSVSQIKKESATPRRSSVARPAPLLQQSQQ